MKRVILVHGLNGYPQEGWHPWLIRELENRQVKVINPAMPNPHSPKQRYWVSKLQEVVGNPDENTFLIGHSLGCITILRYLESLHGSQRIGGVILLAGFTDDLDIQELKDFFRKDINWEEIKKHCGRLISIHSDDDPVVPLEYGNIFKEKLNAEEITEHEKKHFSGDDDIYELPILLEKLTELLR